MSRPSVDDPGSDTESVLSSSQPPSTLAGAGASAGSRSLAGGLYSSNASTLNLSVFAGGPTASHPHASSSSPSSPAASAGLLGGFNALSTVLNSPHKRQHPIDPNSSRYPPLPTHKDAEIKRPKRESVKQYVDEVSKEWDKWTRSRRLGASGSAKTLREKQQKGEGDAAGEASTDAAIAKKGKLPPLSAIPQVFFEEDFNLGNPYTFDVVTERYGAVTAGSSSGSAPNDSAAAAANPASQASQPSLDDKLSHYSDLVEQHLLSEISLRSSSFFSALSTLQDLSSASSSTLSVISSLRSDLISVREQHVKAGLQVVRKQDERRVLVRRMRGVERVKRWCEGKRMVELMVGQGEYEEGLMVIEGLRADLRPTQRDETKPGSALRDGASSPALNGDEEHEGLNGLTGAPADEDEDEEEEVDLCQIPAISALVPDLDELEATISGQLEAELVGVLQHGLEQQDSPSSELSWSLHDRVRPLIHGLVRTSGLEQAMTSSYRPLALISIRHALRKSLQPSAPTLAADGQGESDAEPMLAALFDLLDDDVAASGKGESRSGEAGARAAQRLREMTTDEFAPLLQRVCEGLEAQVARIEVQERGVLSILDQLARQDGASTTDSSIPDATSGTASHHQYQMPTQISYGLPNTLASQLHASIEAAHILVARLISLRATAHAQLSMREFLGLYDPLMAFVERTERIEIRPRAAAAAATAATVTTTTSNSSVGMRRLIPLRSTLLNQSKDWLRHFHRVRLEKAARWVEEETWSQAEVPASSVELVSKLVQCASEDAEGWGPSDQAEKAAEETEGGETSPTLVIPSEAPSSDGGMAVDAGDRKSFYVVPATLRVLDLTKEYTQAVIGMSRVTGTMEIMSREVEFLKQFNSRTCQVVLGAGAMRSAGLKNITAKHLALASQSLSLFIHLIPYLRECVRRHLPDERQAVMLVEFDKLRRDFQEHMFEIHAKLVAIMGDRLGVHCRTLSATLWNAPLPNAAGEDGEEPQHLQPNKAIQDLVKETSTLHKVLSKYLHSNVVESITAQVLSAITQRIGTEFARVEVTREGGENAMKRMEADVDYLDVKLGSLKGVERNEGEGGGGWDVRGLRAVVSSKTPPPPPQTQPAANNTTSKAPQSAPAASNTTNAPGSAPSSPVPGGGASSSPRTGPAAYRSKMFPFGRRAAATQQQQGTPPRSGSPAANAGSRTLVRTASTGAQGRTSHDTPPSLARTGSALGGAAGRGSVDELFAPSQQQQGSAENSSRPSMDVVSLPPSVVAAVPPEEAVVVEEKVEERDGEAKSSGAQEVAEQTTTAATVNEDEGPAIVPSAEEAAGAELGAEAKDQPGTAEEKQPPPHEASAEAGKEQSQPEAAATTDEATATATTEPPSSTDSPPPPSPPSHDQSPAVAAPAPSTSDVAATPSTSAPSNAPAQETPISPAPTSPAPSASGTSTPTRPARQTLQQRLAEAARKRSAAAAAASASAGGRPSTPPLKGEEKEKEVPPPPTPEKDRSRSREPAGRGSVEEGAGAKQGASTEVHGEQQQAEEEKVAAAEEKGVPEVASATPASAVAPAEVKDEAAADGVTAQVSVPKQPKDVVQAVREPLEERPVHSVEEKEAAPAVAVDEPLSTSSAPPLVAATGEDAAPSASDPPAEATVEKDDGASGQAEAVAEEAKPVEEQQRSTEETATADPVSTDSTLTTTMSTTSSGAATPKSTAEGSDNEGEGDGGNDEEADKDTAAATATATPAGGSAGGGGNGKKSGNKKKNKKKKGKK